MIICHFFSSYNPKRNENIWKFKKETASRDASLRKWKSNDGNFGGKINYQKAILAGVIFSITRAIDKRFDLWLQINVYVYCWTKPYSVGKWALIVKRVVFMRNEICCRYSKELWILRRKNAVSKELVLKRTGTCCANVNRFFLAFSGAEIWPLSQWNLGDFFPNFEQKSQSLKIFFEEWDFHLATWWQSTTASYLSFKFLMTKVYVIGHLFFFIDQKWHNCAL